MEAIEVSLGVRPLLKEICDYLKFSEIQANRLVSKSSCILIRQAILDGLHQRGITATITSDAHLLFIQRLLQRRKKNHPISLVLHLTQLPLPLHHQVWKVFWGSLTVKFPPWRSGISLTVQPYSKWVLQSMILGADTFDEESEKFLQAIDAHFAKVEESTPRDELERDIPSSLYVNCADASVVNISVQDVVTHCQEVGTKKFATDVRLLYLRSRGPKLHLSHNITCMGEEDRELVLSRNGLRELSIAEGLILPPNLTLDENYFTEFPAEAIQSGKFTYVSLTYNHLTTLSSSLELTHLTDLYLECCNISEFPASFAKCLPNLITLNLNDNPLVSFDPFLWAYSRAPLGGRVFSLSLRRVRLTELRLSLQPNRHYAILLEGTILTKLHFIVDDQEHLVVIDDELGMWTDQKYLTDAGITINLQLDPSYPGYCVDYLPYRTKSKDRHDYDEFSYDYDEFSYDELEYSELLCKFDTHITRDKVT